MVSRILVPTTPDEVPKIVLDRALGLARQLGAELLLLHVIPVVPSEDYFFKRIQVEEGSAAHKATLAAEAALPAIEAGLRAEGVAVRSQILVSDQPEAEAIARFAQEAGCDLIVVPNESHAGVGRWLFSSLGDKVRRRSTVPVLFV